MFLGSFFLSSLLNKEIKYNSANYDFSNNILHIFGDGSVDAEATKEYKSKTNEVYINESVEEIGDSAFKDFVNLQKVEITSTMKIINSYAFSGCNNLVTITIPDTVTEFGDSILE
ncbi:hypothetical protein TVAG_437910 [Trichomonas vaginalis G3]|uniref:Surface antigen BspA-like n=1 Tax=Trichomonas vaginalis (strain ATCC PRA-98 / G3) TaxID=412133 RepID=A2FCF3_TRIV3|nr:ribonuclease inhibitor domain-containing protein [Trichomonas vaginalis G3]EAX97413.1 hypothetical protein TVAG_437910 [Trichomonas vaginalis G3]KAI5516886.1 ribonuclease inhibitor domain-containing protein [Trichomonas vaginalis G3]|eukprot:XP_001310343.1 hypothetical protein [Trichomonas vaginalis G3]